MRLTRLALALLTFAAVLTAAAKPLHIPRVNRPPKLADYILGTPREAETEISDFFQFDPNDGAPASQKTTAYLSYDSKNLYVGWVCMDDPSKIRARIAKRKDIANDDRITINIDTFHDHKRAYFFDVNPYGVQMDGITTDGQGDDFTFETLWYSEAKILEDRYVILETIPFRSLRFPEGPGRIWGIGLLRFIGRNNEMSAWPAVSHKGLPQFVGQYGDLEGIEGVSSGRNLQLVPYTAASKSRLFDDGGPGPARYRNDHDIRGGLDAKTVIHDSLTLDATINPDFSQVESDEPQVTVNQRYEVFFPEHRPFFTENAAMFQTPENLFHSRRIADPQFGARLTGKLGRWALAALAADDRAPGAQVSEDDSLHGDRAIDGVVRVQREFGRQSHFGVLATDSEFGYGFNRVISADTRLVLPDHWSVVAQAVGSFDRSRYAQQSSTRTGQIVRASVSRNTLHTNYSASYIDRSPDFRSALGYVNRVDIRQASQSFGYRWRPENGRIVSFGPYVSGSLNWDRAGHLQDWSANPQFSLELKRQTSFTIAREEAFERYQAIGFRKHYTVGVFNSEWFRWLAWSSTVVAGESVNYYPAAGLLPFGAKERSGQFQLTLRPKPRLRLDETYDYTRLAASHTVFNDHVVRSKVSYQFSRSLSARAILDYHGALPNAQLVALDRSKRLGVDFLITYLLHPGTALYAGYNSGWENFSFRPTESPQWRQTADPTGLRGRQVFVKLSYMFRY
jgi:hypothetical protein